MKKVQPLVKVRAQAEFQILGDVDGAVWMSEVLQTPKTEERILDFNILNHMTGAYGLQLVTFTVDAHLTWAELNDPKSYFTTLLNKIVNDTDVEVRWIERLS